MRGSGSRPLSRSSQLSSSPISAHRTRTRKSPLSSQVDDPQQVQISSSARLAHHAETLNNALLAIFGNRSATFYELVAEINTFPKLEGMEALGAALNEPNFQKRSIKDIPYLFDFDTRDLIEKDKEKLEHDVPQLQALNDVIEKLSEFVSYFETINSELSHAIQKLLDYYQAKREQICEVPSSRSEILEQRGFVAGLSLKLTSVDIETLCMASSVTREGSFKKQNRYGGSLVSKLLVPNTDDYVFTKLGVVYGNDIEPLKYGQHCLNAAILEVGPMLPIVKLHPLSWRQSF